MTHASHCLRPTPKINYKDDREMCPVSCRWDSRHHRRYFSTLSICRVKNSPVCYMIQNPSLAPDPQAPEVSTHICRRKMKSSMQPRKNTLSSFKPHCLRILSLFLYSVHHTCLSNNSLIPSLLSTTNLCKAASVSLHSSMYLRFILHSKLKFTVTQISNKFCIKLQCS